MVRRSIPIARRIAINSGRIVGALVWAGAALTCVVLYPLKHSTNGGVAMAVVRDAPVRAPESGRLAQLAVTSGQAIRAGDLIAVVEVPGLTQQITAAEGRLATLRATADSDALDAARKYAKDADASRARWLSAQVNLEAARARLTAIDQDLARLRAPGIEIARGDVEQHEAQRRAVETEIAARQAEVAALRSATSSAESRAGGGAMSPAEAELMEATAELEGLRAREAVLRLTAPMDGVVGQELPVLGLWVAAGDVIARVNDRQVDLAVAYVSVQAARGITAGDAADLVGPGGDAYQATVSTVGGAVETVPLQLRGDPAVPSWGVPVMLRVQDRPLVPGEVLAVSF